MPRLRVLTETVDSSPVLDTATSHAILRSVASGEITDTLRLYRPAPAVLFSLLDARRPGFQNALAIARAAGFGAVLRLGGGHAAVFDRGTLAFSWARASAHSHSRIRQRFDEMSDITVRALRSLGIDAREGEVPGEYCPGEHSVNAGGRTKLMGVGQRVIKGAAHVGGVIVVTEPERVRDILVPVYEALELEFDPATVGAAQSEAKDADFAAVEKALRAAFSVGWTLEDAEIDAPLLARASDYAHFHEPPSV